MVNFSKHPDDRPHGSTKKLHEIVPRLEGELTRQDREDLRNALLKIEGNTNLYYGGGGGGGGGTTTPMNIIGIIRYSSGRPYFYSFDETGLDRANDDLSSGEALFIPAGSITLTKTLAIKADTAWVGHSRDNTVLTRTAATTDMITLAKGATIESMALTMTTATSGANVISSTQGIMRDLNITSTHTATGDVIKGVLYDTGNDELFPSIDNINVLLTGCTGNISIDAIDIDDAGAGTKGFIRDVTVTVENHTAGGSLDCVYLDGSGGRIYANNINVYANVSGEADTWGIYGEYSTIKNSHVYIYGDDPGDGVFGFVATRSCKLFDCSAIVEVVNCDGNEDVAGIYSGSSTIDTLLSNCYFEVIDDGSALSSQGIWHYAATVDVYAYNCTFIGSDQDIYVDDGNVMYVYSCQYDTTDLQGGATIAPMGGDRASITGDNTFTGTNTFTGDTTFNGDVIVNEEGANDQIFRVEGDTEVNLIITDAANNRVGIATASPTVPLEVTGETKITGAVGITGTTTVTGSSILEGAVTINDTGAEVDTRIESNTEENMVFVDGSADDLFLGGTTNGIRIDKGGELTLIGTATVWDDIRVPLSSVKRIGNSDPDWETFIDGTYALAFDASTDQEVIFSVQVPHSWALGTDIEPHVHWAPSTTDTGDVTWKMEYTIANINGTFGNTTTISASDAGDGTALKHQYVDIGTIDMSSYTADTDVSIMLLCRLYRDVSDADDYADDAFLLEIDFHYQINTMGSKLETSK